MRSQEPRLLFLPAPRPQFGPPSAGGAVRWRDPGLDCLLFLAWAAAALRCAGEPGSGGGQGRGTVVARWSGPVPRRGVGRASCQEPCSAGPGTGRSPWGTLTVSSSRASASWARRRAACPRSGAAWARGPVSGRPEQRTWEAPAGTPGSEPCLSGVSWSGPPAPYEEGPGGDTMWRRAWIRRWDPTADPPFPGLQPQSSLFQEAWTLSPFLSPQRFQVPILPRKKLKV